MATIFTKIIDGEIPGTFVYEDEQCVAFLDVSPLTAGHTMVVPRAEISEWTDLDEELLDHLMNVAHRIGRAQKEAFDCERIVDDRRLRSAPRPHPCVADDLDGRLRHLRSGPHAERGDAGRARREDPAGPGAAVLTQQS